MRGSTWDVVRPCDLWIDVFEAFNWMRGKVLVMALCSLYLESFSYRDFHKLF